MYCNLLHQSYIGQLMPVVNTGLNTINTTTFNNYVGKAMTLLEEMKLQNQHNAKVISDCQSMINDNGALAEMSKMVNDSAPVAMVFNSSNGGEVFGPKQMSLFEKFLLRGKVEPGDLGDGGPIGQGIETIKESLSSIAKFCSGVSWIVEHPRETFKIILGGVCEFVEVVALLVCAASLIGAIFGHKEGIKWTPVAITVFTLLKILVVIL